MSSAGVRIGVLSTNLQTLTVQHCIIREINCDEKFGEFAIYSVNGQLLKSGELESTTIDISSLTSGSYVLVVDNKNHSVEKQLIIE